MIRLLAALTFFTRLPFWRLAELPPTQFKRIVAYWPLTGWFTAGITALVLYASSLIVPAGTAVLLALLTRILLTGALHEDGLADFCDGFGSGSGKARTLEIMKDSRTGTYGVIGLVFYFLLTYTVLAEMPLALAGSAILAGDPFCKGVASLTINRLPYARTESTSKSGIVYDRMTTSETLLAVLSGLAPFVWLPAPKYGLAVFAVVPVWYGLTAWMKKRIGGYTGDCCGAADLLCELTFYLSVLAIHSV